MRLNPIRTSLMYLTPQRFSRLFARLAFAGLIALLPAQSLAQAQAEKYTAMLVWGTDGEKPADKDLKEVEGKLVEKFKKIFKWKNYYEVNRNDFTLKPGESKHLKLSDKCEVKLLLTEKEGMEVELIGEKVSVYKGRQSMPLKDVLIVAGDDKNATAWFVVLKPR